MEFKSSNAAQVCDNCGARHPEEKSCLKFWQDYSMEKLGQVNPLLEKLKVAVECHANAVASMLENQAHVNNKLRHAMWAINSLARLDISKTQRAIIDLALEKIKAK